MITRRRREITWSHVAPIVSLSVTRPSATNFLKPFDCLKDARPTHRSFQELKYFRSLLAIPIWWYSLFLDAKTKQSLRNFLYTLVNRYVMLHICKKKAEHKVIYKYFRNLSKN